MLALLECRMNLWTAQQMRVLNRTEIRGAWGCEVEQKREGGHQAHLREHAECWGTAYSLMKEALIHSSLYWKPPTNWEAQRELFIWLKLQPVSVQIKSRQICNPINRDHMLCVSWVQWLILLTEDFEWRTTVMPGSKNYPQNLLIHDVIWQCICVCADVTWFANLSLMEGSAHIWRSDIPVAMETSTPKPSPELYCTVASLRDLHSACACVHPRAGVYMRTLALSVCKMFCGLKSA